MAHSAADFGVFDVRIRYVWQDRLFELQLSLDEGAPTSVFFDREEMERAKKSIDENRNVVLSPDGDWEEDVPGVRVREIREPFELSQYALRSSTPLCWHHANTCYWFCMSG